jgi:hypothetical protein
MKRKRIQESEQSNVQTLYVILRVQQGLYELYGQAYCKLSQESLSTCCHYYWVNSLQYPFISFLPDSPAHQNNYVHIYKGNVSGGNQHLHVNYENFNLSHTMLIQRGAQRRWEE